MYSLSNEIEQFLHSLIDCSGEPYILIQRNELAVKFKCSPSQINYVLTTRFNSNKGYYIESKRGGGGHILIKKTYVKDKSCLQSEIIKSIGESITTSCANDIIDYLYRENFLNTRDCEIIKGAINDRNFKNIDKKNELKAEILKSIICVILNEYYNEENN